MKQQAKITVNVNQTTAKLGDLYGIFFEDINHAADGGLYAEMVQNRSFEFCAVDNANYYPLMAWELIENKGAVINWSIQDTHPYSRKNPHYLVCDIRQTGLGAGIRNKGFEPGMYFEAGEVYDLTFLAANDGRESIPVRVVLEDKNGQKLSETLITIKSDKNWNRYEASLDVTNDCMAGSLAIYFEAAGRVYMDMISLFPRHTYANQKNGLRKDIAKMLAELTPKFMRFPGGCLVHDGSLNADDRDAQYRWKNTIGALEERAAKRNNWGYNQTLGLGYYEYFCFCEEIGAKALPVLPAAYDPHHQRKVPFEQLGEWVQEALDLIEFANGDSSTKWGKIRAALGHENPFGLEYIAIGNEEVGEGFFERYPYFHKAIKEKYPDINIIASSGPFAAGGEFEKGWNCAIENHADFVDEHYYQAPEWFLANHERYAKYSSQNPKVFLGEYASWGNTWYNALTEASYMIGMENSAPVVGLACYAPLLCNVNYVNWKPDMIWFNNHQVFGTANYYVQKLFMNNQGDDRLKFSIDELNADIKVREDNPIGNFGFRPQPDTCASFYDIKVEFLESNKVWEYKDTIYMGKNAEKYQNQTGAVCYEQECNLTEINESHYRISFKAKALLGRRGFMLQFGQKDTGNRYSWELGGWQNLDSAITQDISHRNSCLTQSEFSVEQDREYSLCLEVDGRYMKAYVDGVLIHEINHTPVVIKPIYVTASKDNKTGETIVKLVNVQNEPIDVEVTLEGISADKEISATAYVLEGYAPGAENSFEEPKKIYPREESIQLQQSRLNYHVPKESVQILRFKYN